MLRQYKDKFRALLTHAFPPSSPSPYHAIYAILLRPRQSVLPISPLTAAPQAIHSPVPSKDISFLSRILAQPRSSDTPHSPSHLSHLFLFSRPPRSYHKQTAREQEDAICFDCLPLCCRHARPSTQGTYRTPHRWP